ncbi:SUMF1/EgtB/PvdO family nonheme iron enzyme [Gimesia algae]|uniref:Serine/threonine-protein kinase pkn1 n=1 Tax=Gimesia algae TaxID=2527971 RepID=A0A517VHX4_9PLAN|nr:SUMF1/EgtB/PvdO family nonheme iron enzyme [Gimesia algae]QDT92620.1 Serine/threonine-protein kinase pkn1 [Gimesia algae]
MRVKPVFLCLSSPAALATDDQVKYTGNKDQEIQQTKSFHVPITTSRTIEAIMTFTQLSQTEIEKKVLSIVSEQLGFALEKLSLNDRLIEDLKCDSLAMTGLLMELEDTFSITISHDTSDPALKAIFTRQPFRLSDLVQLVTIQLGIKALPRADWFRQPAIEPGRGQRVCFTQLDGILKQAALSEADLFVPLESTVPCPAWRRHIDGMRCIRIPAGNVILGSDLPAANPDEQPVHQVELDAFLIDAEPVSTTAYCRFLNSVGKLPDSCLTDWFVLDMDDDRDVHMLIQNTDNGWQPLPGCEIWPMILVSWYGANAYSLWANNRLWSNYRDETGEAEGSYLPTEAQWEYAARGATPRAYPWGNDAPTPEKLRAGLHRQQVNYETQTLPLSPVNETLGMSPFGLHHMAGNVWQWCRDWYDEDFYRQPGSTQRNPCNHSLTLVRSERGGSWVGPDILCRSSYRRGRPPIARGRCLGFRCVSSVQDLP